jgi:hypothetical protein
MARRAVVNEVCGDQDCLICYPLVTANGRVITEDELDAWAEEAERGYGL